MALEITELENILWNKQKFSDESNCFSQLLIVEIYRCEVRCFIGVQFPELIRYREIFIGIKQNKNYRKMLVIESEE